MVNKISWGWLVEKVTNQNRVFRVNYTIQLEMGMVEK
jgi:hypothetical protein